MPATRVSRLRRWPVRPHLVHVVSTTPRVPGTTSDAAGKTKRLTAVIMKTASSGKALSSASMRATSSRQAMRARLLPAGVGLASPALASLVPASTAACAGAAGLRAGRPSNCSA